MKENGPYLETGGGKLLTATEIDPRLGSAEEFKMVESLDFDSLYPGAEFIYAEPVRLHYVRVEMLSEIGKPRVVRRSIDGLRNLSQARAAASELGNIITIMGSCEGVDDKYSHPRGLLDEGRLMVSACAWFLMPKSIDSELEEPTNFTEEISKPIQKIAIVA